MTKQEYYDEQRAAYLDGKMTFQEFYNWLGLFIGLPDSVVLSVAPIEKLKACLVTDENLNNIPLIQWYRKDAHVRCFVGGLNWSLSDTVCVPKARARAICQKEEGACAIVG